MDKEKALCYAILEWQDRGNTEDIDWKAVVKIIAKKFPSLVGGKKGISVAEWQNLWESIASGDHQDTLRRNQTTSSTIESSSPQELKKGTKRKLTLEDENAQCLDCQNTLPSKAYYDLMNGENDPLSDKRNRNDPVKTYEGRKRVLDKYCDSQPIMHRYNSSVNMLFYPTVMTDVLDTGLNSTKTKVGLLSKTVVLNPMTSKIVTRSNNAAAS